MHPILFKIGPLTFYSYGLMLLIAYFVSSSLAVRYTSLSQAKIQSDQLLNLFFFSLIGGILGARFMYIVLNWSFYAVNPSQIIRFDHGGLVWYGGFLGGLLTALCYLRIKKLPFLETADLVSPYLVLAHSIGRVGCFLNGCCFGKPTNSIFGIYFPLRQDHIDMIKQYYYSDNDAVYRSIQLGLIRLHPTQLYSLTALFLIFLLLKSWRKYKTFDGELSLAYLLLYSIWRFGIEFLRGDNLAVWNGLTLAQVISIPVAIVSGLLLYRFRR